MTIGLGSRPSQVPIRSRPIRQLRFSSRTSPESPTSCYSISRHSSHRKQMDLAIDSIVRGLETSHVSASLAMGIRLIFRVTSLTPNTERFEIVHIFSSVGLGSCYLL